MMEFVVTDTHFFFNTELGHHLHVIQLVSFLQQTHTSFEQPPVLYCAALREELLLVA
jgi:hypothetical protein